MKFYSLFTQTDTNYSVKLSLGNCYSHEYNALALFPSLVYYSCNFFCKFNFTINVILFNTYIYIYWLVFLFLADISIIHKWWCLFYSFLMNNFSLYHQFYLPEFPEQCWTSAVTDDHIPWECDKNDCPSSPRKWHCLLVSVKFSISN